MPTKGPNIADLIKPQNKISMSLYVTLQLCFKLHASWIDYSNLL